MFSFDSDDRLFGDHQYDHRCAETNDCDVCVCVCVFYCSSCVLPCKQTSLALCIAAPVLHNGLSVLAPAQFGLPVSTPVSNPHNPAAAAISMQSSDTVLIEDLIEDLL